mgnify:CR=1 FL=1
MRGAICLALVLAAGALVGGCYPEPTTLNLRFPTENSFLYADEAQVVRFNVRESELGICPSLVSQVNEGAGDREAIEDRTVSVCSLRDGGLEFEDIGDGKRAFVVVVRDQFSTALLTGCIITDTYVDAPEIALALALTEDYTDALERIGELQCTDIDEKCSRGC